MLASRTRRLSRVLFWLSQVCVAGICVLLLVLAQSVVAGVESPAFSYVSFGFELTEEMSPWTLWGFYPLWLVQLALLAAALWRLGKVFQAFQKTEVFELSTALHMRAFGRFLLAFVFARILARPLEGLISAAFNWRDVQSQITIFFNSDDIFLFLMAGVFLVISHVWIEASLAVTENRAFV